ncbi:MAG: hypothetical protein Tsb0034_11300 [Ekhidna sp.]
MKHFLILTLSLISFNGISQEQLYKVTLLRAKPGELLNVIDKINQDVKRHSNFLDHEPYLLRHSQGDHWDLMLIYPIQELDKYFSNSAINKRSASQTIEKKYGDAFFDLIAFQEEAIVAGPDQESFIEALSSYQLFHIEIFTALAGKQAELEKQRKMENEYYSHIDHRPNMIFTRVFGASWDNFTIGAYTDMHDFAGPEVSFEAEDEAAKKAGFEGVNYIGSYLRSLISGHHDTLAWKVERD